MERFDLHALYLAPPANDCDQAARPERLPSAWQARRESAAGAVVDALRARGVTGGQCARHWHEPPRRALERLAGHRPLCAEHLSALPAAARAAVLEALKKAALSPGKTTAREASPGRKGQRTWTA